MGDPQLPPEPGEVPDVGLGIPDHEVVFGDNGEQFDSEVNDDEDEEDD